jgi:hypothetical protein
MKKQALFLVTLFTFAFGTVFSRIADSTSVTPTDSFSVFPNPFSCSTNITFNLIKSDTVTLILYNRWGQLVKTILKPTFMQSGSHNLKLFGDSLSQDSYVLSLGVRSRKTIGKNIFKDSTAQSVSPIITASGATTFCDGNGVTLTSSIPSGNKWSNGATTRSIVVTKPGIYYVSNTSDGCSSTSEAININVLPKPNVGISASTATVCTGSLVILKASGAVFYTWSDSIKNGIAFIPSGTKTYTVTGTDSNQCSKTVVKTITVSKNTPPRVIANTSADIICSGSSVTLTGAGASSYKWSTGGTTSSITLNPTGTKTYTVIGIDSNKCFNTATVKVYVNPLPKLSVTASASTICIGSDVTLKAFGATFYSWLPGGFTTAAITETPQTTKTYTLTGTDSNGCSKTIVKTIVVNSKYPKVTAKAILASGATGKVCAGNEVTLYGLGADSYKWSNGIKDSVAFVPTKTNTYTVTGISNACASSAKITITVKTNTAPTVTITASALTVCEGTEVKLYRSALANISYVWLSAKEDTSRSITVFPRGNMATYTVKGTDANNCYQTATQTITVKTAPRVGGYASSNGAVCAGTPVTLKGFGADKFYWSNNVKDSIVFVPTSTKTYTVVGIGTNSCIGTAEVTVVVNKIPSVSAGSALTTVCNGTVVTLKGAGASFYTWSDSIVDGATIVAYTNKTFTVTGVDSNGCSKTVVKSITVNPRPNVTASVSRNIVCAGESVTVKGSGAVSYVWSGGVKDSVAFTPAGINTYVVTGTGINKCTGTASVRVYVNKLPSVGITASSSTVCIGNPVTLTGTGAYYYSWSDSIKNGSAFTPSVTKTYTVTGIDSNKCSKTVVKTITVNPYPKVSAQASMTTVCSGNTVILTGDGAASYTWTSPVKNGVAFTPSATKTYTVTGKANGCSSTATITVALKQNTIKNVVANATLSSVCPGTSVILTGSGAVYYSWTGGIKDGVSFVPKETQTYTVTGTDSNNCYRTAVKTITVNKDSSLCKNVVKRASASSTFIEVEDMSSEISIYPNPFSTQTTINFPEEQTNTTIKIIDVLGTILETISFTGSQLILDKGDLNSGVYFVQIIDSNKNVVNKKIIIR